MCRRPDYFRLRNLNCRGLRKHSYLALQIRESPFWAVMGLTEDPSSPASESGRSIHSIVVLQQKWETKLDLCLTTGPLSSVESKISLLECQLHIHFLSKQLVNHKGLITSLCACAKCSLFHVADDYIVFQEIKKSPWVDCEGTCSRHQGYDFGTPGRRSAVQCPAPTWHSINVCECANE